MNTRRKYAEILLTFRSQRNCAEILPRMLNDEIKCRISAAFPWNFDGNSMGDVGFSWKFHGISKLHGICMEMPNDVEFVMDFLLNLYGVSVEIPWNCLVNSITKPMGI